MTVLSGPSLRKRGRCALRIELRDGRVIKARRLESAKAARDLFEIRSGLETAFAPAIGWHDAVVVEEWVEGTPLERVATEFRIEEAGALLGRLHAAPQSGPDVVPTARWLEEAIEQLHVVRLESKLRTEEVASLEGMLRDGDPGLAPNGIVHKDFCPENMIVDAAGQIRVIDNEWMEMGPIGFDLSRTRGRWPMSAFEWEGFLDGYGSEVRDPIASQKFWWIVTALFTSRIRWNESVEHLSEPLGWLRTISASGDSS